MDRRPHVPWWGAILLVALGFVLMLGALWAAGALRSAVSGLPPAVTHRAVREDMLSIGFAQVLGFGGVVLLGMRLFARPLPVDDALALRPARAGVLPAAVALGVGLQFVLSEIGNWVSYVAPVPLEERLRLARLLTPETLSGAASVVLAVVVVAPVTEELLFRGLLFRGLSRAHGVVVGTLLSSVAFGAAHGVTVAIVFASVAGVVFAAVMARTGSLWVTLTTHMAVNATPLLLPEKLLRIPGFNTVDAGVVHVPLPLLLGATILSGFALWVILRERTDLP